jgi:hypothetical protein
MLNKWLIINNEDGYIVAGQVRETFGMDSSWCGRRLVPDRPICISMISPRWRNRKTLVFNSKDEMNAYIAWMEGPSTSKKGKVIKLHPKHGDE